MSGTIIAEKHIVIKAVDKVTKPLAEMNMRLDKFEAALNGLSGKFTNASSGQQAFRQAMDATKATVGETEKSTHKLQEQIDRLKGKTVKVEGDTNQAQQSLEKVKKTADELSKRSPKIKPTVDDTELRRGQRESTKFERILGSLNGTMKRIGGSGFLAGVNEKLQQAQRHAKDTESSFVRLRTVIAGTAIGGLVANGISASWGLVKSAIGGAIGAGLQYNRLQQNMKAQWSTLTGSAKEGQKLVDMTNKLAIAAQNSTEMVNGLNQQYYAVTENAKKTRELTQATLTLQDAFGKSDAEVQNFSLQFSQMMANGKASAQDFLSFTNVFPKMKQELVAYEREVKHNTKLTTADINEMISNGEVSSEDMFKVMMRMQDKYKDATKNFSSTLDGMARTIKGTVPRLMGEMTKGMAEQANPIFQQVSAWVSDKRTEREFQRLGGALNQGVAAVMQSLADALGDGSISKMLDNMVNSLTKFIKAISGWTADNASSIVRTIKALATIGKDLTVGAFNAISGFLRIVTGTKSKGLEGVADALTAIAKHETAIKVIGGVLGTYFLTTKLISAAKYFDSIHRSLVLISTLGLRKSATGTLLGDLINLGTDGKSATQLTKFGDFLGRLKDKTVKVRPVMDEQATTRMARYGSEAGDGFVARFVAKTKGLGSKLTGVFGRTKTAAGMAGAEAGAEFTTRMGARAVESKGLLSVGKGIAGKLGAGISLGLSVIDFARGLTPSFKGDRWSMIGKGAGGLIGGGIGAFFGGPAGAAIGATIGNVLGGWVGKGAHKGWDLLTKVFNGDVSWSGVKKGFRSAMDSVAKWAGDTWSKITKWWNGEDDNKSKSSKSSKKQPSTQVVESLGGNNYSKRDIANVKAMNAAITAYTDSLKRLKSATKKNDPSKEINAMNKALTGSQKKLTSYAKTMASFAKGFKALDKATKSLTTLKKELDKLGGKNDGFKKLAKDIQSLATTIKKTKFGTEIAKQMKAASEAVNGKHSFVGQFGKMISTLKSDLNSFKRTFTRDWRNVWRDLDDDADKGLSNVAKRVDSRFDSILSRTKKFESSFLKSWKGWISDVKSAFKSGFNKLPDYAASSMRQIVSRLNRGISGINSVISQFGGDKRLSTINYANGTLSHPGGKAILNDGPTPYKQELVWQPSRGWSLPKTQNAVYDLEPNSMVLDAPHTHSILSKAGIPHYAGGTLSDTEMDKIAEQFMNNPKQASRNLVLKLTDWSSSVRLVSGFGKSLAVGFSQSIANVLKDLLGIIKEPINGDWTPVIKSAFHYMQLPAAGWKVAKLLRQIQTESGGNQRIMQQIDDVNSRAGHPAQGLLQFIPSTFATWAIAGHHNIMSGFDQILAAINALEHGGEGGWGNVGNGHGWAGGVHMTHLDRAWIGDNPEHDEFVINPYSASAIPLMSEAWSTIMSHRPELRQTSANGFGQQLVSLVKMAVDRLDNIDIHPVVEMSELRRINDKQNALVYRQAKG